MQPNVLAPLFCNLLSFLSYRMHSFKVIATRIFKAWIYLLIAILLHSQIDSMEFIDLDSICFPDHDTKTFFTSNMLVFWSACLSCLPVCQSNFNGWFRSQGKYKATLEFKSSGCVVSNNLIYDSGLSLLVSAKVIPKSFDTCLNST